MNHNPPDEKARTPVDVDLDRVWLGAATHSRSQRVVQFRDWFQLSDHISNEVRVPFRDRVSSLGLSDETHEVNASYAHIGNPASIGGRSISRIDFSFDLHLFAGSSLDARRTLAGILRSGNERLALKFRGGERQRIGSIRS